ncbi:MULTISPECIES: CDP-glycerol glycerophosphotransferase family protein [unclassified Agrococcus]|uniref:CDP-glycerol glycerophosphotransferase family protein n=1 Tax=unclassified Agrococcus TaxID=2615065 RepID=UPI003623409B
MPLRRDLAAARRLLRNGLTSRRNRAEVARTRAQHEATHPGDVEIAVYYADGPVNLYQLRQWYEPLRALSQTHTVGILARSPGAALQLWQETDLPVFSVTQVRDLEDFLEHRGPRLVLYVNQNARNFQMMRYGRMWHVFINHGESDKMYMTTNQFKAYDYALVAGQAARDRLGAKLWDYDLERRTLEIGRPQADHFAGEVPYPRDGRRVVLYAPTWEGDRPAGAYGSIVSHGIDIAAAVLASDRHRLVYRPHPRSGVLDADYRAAHERIVSMIDAANRRAASAHHVHDDGPQLGWQLADADVAITDVSAMVYDRLAVGKPILIARPASEEADVDERGYLGACEWMEAGMADPLGEIDRVAEDAEALARLERWSTHYFGDTSPGSATARFHAAIERLLAIWSEHADRHRTDAFEVEIDDEPHEASDEDGPTP